MSELKVIFGKGSLLQGYAALRMELRNADNRLLVQDTCALSAAPDLLGLYQRWQIYHRNYYDLRRWSTRSAEGVVDELDDEGPDEISDVGITNLSDYSEDELVALGDRLVRRLNDWLSVGAFARLEKKIRARLSPAEQIQVVFETEDENLRKLPWWRWEFFDDYRQAGVALSALKGEKLSAIDSALLQTKETRGVRVLGVLGDDRDLDLLSDRQLIAQLPGVESSFLTQPTTDELDDALWQQRWDILFFAGHSSGQGQGYIKLNATKHLTVDELAKSLETAVCRGLKLAIFNSCDGLKLARDLARLNLPAIVVMREPVPNAVAQKFLRFFLERFAQNVPLDIALIEAQRRLIRIEKEFPGASLLPALVQNPAEALPTWQQLSRQRARLDKQLIVSPVARSMVPFALSEDWPEERFSSAVSEGDATDEKSFAVSVPARLWQRYRLVLQISSLVTMVVLLLRLVGWLEPFELQAYDRLMQQRHWLLKESVDDRILIVRVTAEDIDTQPTKPTYEASLSDETLESVFKKLQAYDPVAIGLDIYRPFEATPGLKPYLTQKNVFGICKAKAPSFGDERGLASAPEIAPERVGFADFVRDSDGVLRRQLLSRKADLTGCVAQDSLNFQLALYYLWQVHQLEVEVDENGTLILGDISLKELEAGSAGYHRVDARGRQLLLNYRSLPSPLQVADSVTVSDLLADRVSVEALKNRVVLIGVTRPLYDSRDHWLTPYTASQPNLSREIPGVYIHAHMLSQLMSAALESRPLMSYWPQWVESVWIGVWSLVGGLLALRVRSPRQLGVFVSITIGVLYGLCYLLLVKGLWVPMLPALAVFLMTALGVVLALFYSARTIDTSAR